MLVKDRLILPLTGTLLLVGFLAGCRRGADNSAADVAMASLRNMPPVVQRAPKAVRRAYQFAVANPEILTQIPCYCGCGGMGHTSNYSCYVNVSPSGASQFDGHALGCSICVDIALDAMRMLKEGKSTAEIRFYIDVYYSKYGPTNLL